MRRLPVCRILALTGLALLAANVGAQQIKRWVDEQGVVHYGDAVPPEYAKQDRDVLNGQGVKIGSEQGEITPEEQAEIDAKAKAEAEAARIKSEQARHDRMLLDTYLVPEDIERLRDRRLELLDAQIRVLEIYLTNQRKRHDNLIRDAQRFSPRNPDENAPPLPDNLARDIENTEASIRNYEALLEENRTSQQVIRDDFERDLIRFRQLKGLLPAGVAETASASLAGRKASDNVKTDGHDRYDD